MASIFVCPVYGSSGLGYLEAYVSFNGSYFTGNPALNKESHIKFEPVLPEVSNIVLMVLFLLKHV